MILCLALNLFLSVNIWPVSSSEASLILLRFIFLLPETFRSFKRSASSSCIIILRPKSDLLSIIILISLNLFKFQSLSIP